MRSPVLFILVLLLAGCLAGPTGPPPTPSDGQPDRGAFILDVEETLAAPAKGTCTATAVQVCSSSSFPTRTWYFWANESVHSIDLDLAVAEPQQGRHLVASLECMSLTGQDKCDLPLATGQGNDVSLSFRGALAGDLSLLLTLRMEGLGHEAGLGDAQVYLDGAIQGIAVPLPQAFVRATQTLAYEGTTGPCLPDEPSCTGTPGRTVVESMPSGWIEDLWVNVTWQAATPASEQMAVWVDCQSSFDVCRAANSDQRVLLVSGPSPIEAHFSMLRWPRDAHLSVFVIERSGVLPPTFTRQDYAAQVSYVAVSDGR